MTPSYFDKLLQIYSITAFYSSQEGINTGDFDIKCCYFNTTTKLEMSVNESRSIQAEMWCKMVECTALSLQTSAVVEVVVYWLSLSNGLSQADGHDTREREMVE